MARNLRVTSSPTFVEDCRQIPHPHAFLSWFYGLIGKYEEELKYSF